MHLYDFCNFVLLHGTIGAMAEMHYVPPEPFAEKLQTNARVVRRMLAAGKLPGKRVKRISRVFSQSLRYFIEGGEPPAIPVDRGRTEMWSRDGSPLFFVRTVSKI